MITRRLALFGMVAVAAPAIVRPGILMPVKRILLPDDGVAIRSASHPVTVFLGNHAENPYLDISEDALVRVSLDMVPARRILGVIVNRCVEAGLLCGDVVALK